MRVNRCSAKVPIQELCRSPDQIGMQAPEIKEKEVASFDQQGVQLPCVRSIDQPRRDIRASLGTHVRH